MDADDPPTRLLLELGRRQPLGEACERHLVAGARQRIHHLQVDGRALPLTMLDLDRRQELACKVEGDRAEPALGQGFA